MDVSDLPQNLERKQEIQRSVYDDIQKISADDINEAVADKGQSCQTDEECGYPMYTCYQFDLAKDEQSGLDVALKKCFVTWWMILIIVLISLVVLICIISCIVVACCRICC